MEAREDFKRTMTKEMSIEEKEERVLGFKEIFGIAKYDKPEAMKMLSGITILPLDFDIFMEHLESDDPHVRDFIAKSVGEFFLRKLNHEVLSKYQISNNPHVRNLAIGLETMDKFLSRNWILMHSPPSLRNSLVYRFRLWRLKTEPIRLKELETLREEKNSEILALFER